MKFQEAKRLIEQKREELKSDIRNPSEWALWLPHGEMEELRESMDEAQNLSKHPNPSIDPLVTIKDIDVMVDRLISTPQVLPKSTEEFMDLQWEDVVLEDPPYTLVDDLIELEAEDFALENDLVKANVRYDMESVEWTFYVDEIEDHMEYSEFEEIKRKAFEEEPEEWHADLGDEEFVFTRMTPGIRSYRAMFSKIVPKRSTDWTVPSTDDIEDLDLNFAESALNGINETVTEEVTAKHISRPDPEPVEMVSEEEKADLNQISQMDFEEENVVIGEKKVYLGGIVMI